MRLSGSSSRQTPSLGRQMGRAAAWSSVNSIVLRLGTFAVGILAARLFAPEEFGVFAVALTVHAIIVNASDVGVSAYVVRRRGDLDAVGPTVTTIAVVSAGILTIAMVLSAPWLATQLGASNAAGAVRLLSLTVLLAGMSSVAGALLTREFRQDRKFLADLGYFIVSTAVLLVLALMGGGALALAWSRVAGALVSTVALIAAAPRRYRPGFDRAVVGSVLRFGLPLAGASFLGFLIGNVDYIVVGRLLGAEPLGLYYLAYNIGSWPFVILSPVIASVTMAAFSRVRDDRGQLAARMGTAMSTLVAIALPANALIVGLAQPLVHVVYGDRWAAAVSALAFTAVYGALRVPADLLANVTIAEGRTRAMLYCKIAYLAALVPLMVAGVQIWGIAGAALAQIVGNTAVLLPGLMLILSGLTGYGPRQLAASVARPLLAATAAGVAAHMVAVQLGDGWLALVAGAAAGTGMYAVLVATWARRTAASARDLWAVRADGESAAPYAGGEPSGPLPRLTPSAGTAGA
jgi:PST family polysaccharide transporter